ncbi:Bug family tripartite tricarboxylate transporter substrate binding protein [Ottowia thiooxydans]|uniref:Tripartite-type tricarboxylate transporter receptor subunit TctC n=1 Tax=Ottowia thiooxydans TaxID=219182 RepID=A0ABV2Q3U0_9BURK
MKLFCKTASVFVALLTLTVPMAAVSSEPFPSKQVHLVVPFSPGGATDVVARVVGQKLSLLWNKPVIVENKPGASSTLGADYVRKSPADGYTLLVGGPSGMTATAAVNPKIMRFDPVNDFKPVSVIATMPFVLSVNPDIGIKSVEDLVGLAKANPGKYTYASSGPGSSSHLFTEMFKFMAGVDILHVPYQGSAPGLNAVTAGQVSMVMTPINVISVLAKGGRVLPVGVSTAARTADMPELPPIGDSVKGYALEGWLALFAPKGTPDSVTQKIAADLRTVIQSPDLARTFRENGLVAVGSNPDAALSVVKNDLERWQRVVKMANIKPE